MLVFCPHCTALTHGLPNQINTCAGCHNGFALVDAFCTVSGKPLTQLPSTVLYGSVAMHAHGAARLYRTTDNYRCDYGLKTGVRSVRDEGIKPFRAYYVVALIYFDQIRIYHGTDSSRLDGIRKNGLCPVDHVTVQRRHGFESEGLLRFAGVDKGPAVHHGNHLVECDLSGWIAALDTPFTGEHLNRYLASLPHEVCGIEYREHGRALALAPHAQVQVIHASLPVSTPRPHGHGGSWQRLRRFVLGRSGCD